MSRVISWLRKDGSGTVVDEVVLVVLWGGGVE